MEKQMLGNSLSTFSHVNRPPYVDEGRCVTERILIELASFQVLLETNFEVAFFLKKKKGREKELEN